MRGEKMYYTIGEVAEMLGMCYNSIWAYCKRGYLPAIQLDRTYRIGAKELQKFIRERKVKKSGVK